MSGEFRTEKDSLGEVQVPHGVLYGAQTQRALENFQVSGQRFPRRFIQALGLVKKAAALTNGELGQLDRKLSRAIAEAAGEVEEGRWDEEFVLDVYQTGSGTSTNMNANEVIARRAGQI
ncbi:MAG: lyase family protein, partial [Longimicrobiales bacterium]|nr:lyase family protein [Longimicrobiales bacterium]